MALQVRERAPLRLSIDAITPGGNRRRWGADEPSPANVPSGLTFSTTVPGGFEQLSCTLPRKPNVEYADLERLSTLRVLGPGGEVAWEGRLESSPRVSGDQMAVSPSAVGWQAHLEDDQSAKMIYVDRDLGAWTSMSRDIRLGILGGGVYGITDPTTSPDASTGIPALEVIFDGEWLTSSLPFGMGMYDAGPGNTLASVYYDWASTTSSSSWTVRFASIASDSSTDFNAGEFGSDLQSGVSGSSGTFTPTTARRVLVAQAFFGTSASNNQPNVDIVFDFRRLAVFGNHGLTKRGAVPTEGFYASDVISHAVRTWAPLLSVTSDSISATSFVIPQLAFKDPTTAAQIISGANRYHLNDWAVWEDKTFYYNERGARGRAWRARVGPAQLSETGPSIENLWNGVIVRYNDVDGTTKTVGPTGSGCDTTSTSCEDSDPLNPANQLGIRRWTQLDMGGVSTAAGATEVGRRFLVEAAQYNASGQAQLVGHVEDDRGILRPSWQVRAGDTISFVDAASTEPRRVVKTSYNHDARTCTIDLDAPAQGLDALLQRLQVVLVPLGL